ncbi:unnamed protein product, partial [marine sediment metagenome]
DNTSIQRGTVQAFSDYLVRFTIGIGNITG